MDSAKELQATQEIDSELKQTVVDLINRYGWRNLQRVVDEATRYERSVDYHESQIRVLENRLVAYSAELSKQRAQAESIRRGIDCLIPELKGGALSDLRYTERLISRASKQIKTAQKEIKHHRREVQWASAQQQIRTTDSDPIEALDLSTRLFNSLKRTGVTDVEDVALIISNPGDWDIRGLSDKGLRELTDRYAEYKRFKAQRN